jgi:hypothetical protein
MGVKAMRLWAKHAGRVGGTVAAGLMLASAAVMAQGMQWQMRQSDGTIHLAYEVPERSDQSLLLTCDTGRRRLTIRYVDERDRAREGWQGPVAFSSEGGRLDLIMRAQKEELDDQIVLVATPRWSAELQRMLGGETLHVSLSGETENIPLVGARSGVAALAAACGSR